MLSRMVFLFSENLIKDTQLCFLEEHGISISTEQAQEYLTSFADLYLAFARADNQCSACAPGVRATTQDRSDRGVSNTSGTL
jgi:hypothetical protein